MGLKGDNAFINPSNIELSEDILKAARIILDGDCVAVPTETVYGLAANAFSENACRKIFEIKNRPFIDPLIVHVSDMAMAESIACFNDKARRLAAKFWPGPMTIVLKKKDVIPDLVSANLDTVAIRMPSHKVAHALIVASKVPFAAPSANPFGYVSPTKAEHVRAQLGDKIKLILEGGQCDRGLESTIISLADPNRPLLLRFGPLAREELEAFLGEKVIVPEKNPAQPIAPGMMKSHYSPKANFRLFENESEIPENFDGAIIFLKRPQSPKNNHFWLSENGNLAEVAKNLYDLMRNCDKRYSKILCQKPENSGVGAAINDRLMRASKK